MSALHKVTALLLLTTACLAGCAQPFRVTGTWNADAIRPQTFKNLLVVGVSPDYSQRCDFEWALSRTLRSDTVRAVASCSVMKADEPLSRDAVERIVASLGADGVIASRLVASNFSVKEGGSWDTRGGGKYKATDVGYGAYGMPVIYAEFAVAPSIYSLENEFEIATQLYETHGASLVYTLETKAKSQESRDFILAELCPAITAHLRRAGLIQ
jgi:hypothetical protein